jgi:crotonobetaine/carnitine-CoA ligase
MPMGSPPSTLAPHASEGTAYPGPAGLSSLPAYWAAATPGAPFLCFQGIDAVEGRWTYAEFADAVVAVAGRLALLGVGRGDRVVLHTGNSPAFMVAFWAVLETGAVAVPTIAQYSTDELRFVLEDCDARLIVSTRALEATATAAAGELDCRVIAEADLVVGRPEHRESGDSSAASTDPDDPAIVLYTSGTTSRPKGVMLSHGALLYGARTFAEHFRLQRGDTTLTCLPLFHVNGLALQMLPALLSGSKLVIAPRFSASRYWGWVADHEVTAAHLVAGPIRVLLRNQPSASESHHQLRFMSHGMPLDEPEIAEAESRFGAPLVMVWGSTETGCGGTLMPLDYGRRPGYQRIGPAMRGWEVAVVDPGTHDHAPQSDGQPGELVVRGPGTMLGYLGQPEATAEALRDGWVHTGDIGWRDEDGYFRFVDRLKDMLKPSGENVAAGEIERVLLEHPGVAKCAVVGLPDAVRMELVAAVIVPVEAVQLTEAEIRDWCAGRLAAFKVPSVVEFRDSLPETSIGKVRKAEVKRSLIDGGAGA